MPTSVATDSVLVTLHEVTQVLSSSLEREPMLERIMDAVIQCAGAQRGFLLLDEPGQGLQVQVARNFRKEDIDNPAFSPSRTVIEFVSETGMSQVIDDALTDSRTASSESVAGQGLRSIICVPIKVLDEVVGVLYLDHPGKAANFGRDELRLLEIIVHQAAAPLLGARVRQTAHAGLQAASELQAFQDAVLEGLQTAVVTFDAQGRLRSANPAACMLFEIAGQAIGRANFRTVLGEAMAARLLDAFKAAVAGRSTPSFIVDVQVGATPRSMRCAVSPLRDAAGQTSGILLLVDDDTPRIEAERAREREETELRRVRELFSKYVPEAVVSKIVDSPTSGPEVVEREISVVFADIRGYTTLSEKSTPERLMVKLNRYLTVATRCIMEQRGTLDKFMGDGVMAVFNAPTDLPDHPLAALRAAWAMQRRAARFMEGVSFGVGINTGRAIVGNIGTDEIRNYSCVGDVVNVASRLQGHADGGHVVITTATYNRVREHVRVRPLGPVQVKGRAVPVEALEVLAVHGVND